MMLSIEDHPEQLRSLLDLTPASMVRIASELEVTSSAIAHTLASRSRSIRNESIVELAGMLGVSINKDAIGTLLPRLHLWVVTTPRRRESLLEALEWLGPKNELRCFPVVDDYWSKGGWSFLAIEKISEAPPLTGTAVLVAFGDKALRTVTKTIKSLPPMHPPIFQLNIRRFKSVLEKLMVLSPDTANLTASLLEPVTSFETLPVDPFSNYLTTMRVALGIDTKGVGFVNAHRVKMFEQDEHQVNELETADAYEESAAYTVIQNLERAKAGESAFNILSYPAGSIAGPWCAVSGISIDAVMLPHALHSPAQSGKLIIISDGPDNTIVNCSPSITSADIPRDGGDFLVEFFTPGGGTSSMEIAHVARSEGRFLVKPSGKARKTMSLCEKLFAPKGDEKDDCPRFQIKGIVVGQISFPGFCGK
jgi:hypothetical protein